MVLPFYYSLFRLCQNCLLILETLFLLSKIHCCKCQKMLFGHPGARLYQRKNVPFHNIWYVYIVAWWRSVRPDLAKSRHFVNIKNICHFKGIFSTYLCKILNPHIWSHWWRQALAFTSIVSGGHFARNDARAKYYPFLTAAQKQTRAESKATSSWNDRHICISTAPEKVPSVKMCN